MPARKPSPRTVPASSPNPQNEAVFTQVEAVIRLMAEAGLAELDLSASGLDLKLRRHPTTAPGLPLTGGGLGGPTTGAPLLLSPGLAPLAVGGMAASGPASVMNGAGAAPASATGAAATSNGATAAVVHHQVKSPIAGTFYRAPSPTSAPYVQEGDEVKAGQTLCIVEAMKLMNEIKCDREGKVVKIPVGNATPIEKGVVLFEILPVARQP